MENQDFYDKLIKPFRDQFIQNLISEIDDNLFSPYDQEFNWEERKKPIGQLKNNIIEWSKIYLTNLDEFPYFYITNGNTDSINIIFQTYSEKFSWKKGDYTYYSHYHRAYQKDFLELDFKDTVENLICTWPGYNNGDKIEYNFALDCNAKYKHLDCAYLGLTYPENIDVSYFETVSISFSKPLCIPYNRIGVLFSKQLIPALDTLNRLGYVNLSGVKIVNHLLTNIPNNYWWNKYFTLYKKICDENNLESTNCLLFAYKNNVRIGIAPLWKTYLQ